MNTDYVAVIDYSMYTNYDIIFSVYWIGEI